MTKTTRLDTVMIAGDFASMTGGQAKVAIDSAVLLAEAGLNVVFFAACGPVSELLDHPRIRVICLGQDTILDDKNRARAALDGIWNRSAARTLRDVASNLDPARSVLHCHGYAKALSPSIGPVLARGPLRSVFTLHEYFLACPNGGFYDYRRQEICTRPALGVSCLTTNCDARRALHKGWRVVRGVAAKGPGALPSGLSDVICISETQSRVMAPYLPTGCRIHRVSNPVAANGAPVDANAQDQYLFVGRLSPEKGAIQFAEATRLLGLNALFVGDGPERAAILAANPDAKITGWVSPDVVQVHLGRARALVFPSLWYECQPLVPIEALLRGVPVVAGRWGAAAEVVEDGRNGVIYDAPTTESLCAALGRVARIGTFDSTALARDTAPQMHRDHLIAIYNKMLDRSALPA